MLAFVGGHMILSGMRPESKNHNSDPSRGVRLVMLSTATSLDALAVGLSLALSGISVWYRAW